jgi:phosphatidylglycerol lysyltransferase
MWRKILRGLRRPGLRRAAAGCFSAAVFVLALAVLHRALGRFDLHEVLRIAAGYPAGTLVSALLLALASYAALGGFDWLGLHHVRRSLPAAWAVLISFVSHAVSHNAGFAVLTGGSVRLRMYSTFGLGVAEVGGIVAFAGTSFALGVCALASAAFIGEGDRIAPLLHLPPAVASGIGWCGALLLAGYFAWTALARRPLAIGNWRLATPSLPLAVAQMAVAAADLALVAAALYVLMPMAGTGISYPAFIGLYVVATTAGTLSHVPGGLGVFEGALTFLVPGPAPDILAALLVFRVFYNLVPLVLAALVLAVFELVHRRRHAPQPAWAESLGPALASLLVFASGVVTLWTGTATPSRLPAWLAEPGHLLSGGAAGVMLMLPWGLMRQKRWSHRAAALALGLGALLTLVRGPDWGAAAFQAFALAMLVTAAPLFGRRGHDGLPQPAGWLGGALAVVAGAAWLTWHGDPKALHMLSFVADFEGGRSMRATVVACAAVLAGGWGWHLRRQYGRARQ